MPLSKLFFFLPIIITRTTLCLWPLGAVLGTAPFAVFYTQGILGAPDDMITDPGKILDAAAPDEYHRMFLEVVAYTGNISGYFGTMGKPDTSHLAQGRIGFFGGYRHNPCTNSPFLRAGLKGRRLCLGTNLMPSKTNQLINCRHAQKTPHFAVLLKNASHTGHGAPLKMREF
jgi:hypothetical protein